MCEVLDKVEDRGIKKGIEQGVMQGFDQAQVAMALRMIHAGEPDEKIVEYTGLPERKVKELHVQAGK